MSNYGICWLHHCTYRREASADRSRVYHSNRENSVSSSSHFRARVGRPAAVFSHKRKSNQESHSEQFEEKLKLFPDYLKRKMMRDHLLKNKEIIYLQRAKSEVLKQECRTNFVDCSIREDQRQIHSSRMEIDRNNLGVKHLEESRPDSTKNWRHEKEHFEKLIFKLVTRWKN